MGWCTSSFYKENKPMKKHLLFIYPEMMVGGSTTSLLSVLNLIDYNKYEVDIQFQYGAGPLKDYLPKQINILPFAYSQPRQYYKIRKAFSFTSIVKYFKAKKIRWSWLLLNICSEI